MLILNCKNKVSDIRYYPNNLIKSTKNIKEIDLDSIPLNFKEITDLVRKTKNEKKNLSIEINDNGITKKIIPYVYNGGLIKERNILHLKYDSILIDNGYLITELKPILKRHYTNNGKNYRYSDSPKRAIVELNIDTNKTGTDLKKILINLTRTFDEVKSEVKDSIELRLIFNYFRRNPPPPPPPPTPIELEKKQ